jgi:hypothetical protein
MSSRGGPHADAADDGARISARPGLRRATAKRKTWDGYRLNCTSTPYTYTPLRPFAA